MWKSRKIMLCQGHNIKNSLTLHLRFFQDLLWCSVPNSAEECSGRFVWYYHRFCTSSIHSLLTIVVRPSICDVASAMDASDLEHMHLCSFGIAEFHILLWRDQEWTLTYPWWVAHDLWTWVVRWFPMCGGGGEGVADRMRTCCFSLGRSVGETH